jgi:rRNA-processing protein FCF1
MRRVSSVVDTHLFLHYFQLKDIDWRDLIKADVVKLIVTRTVTQELQKHATLHPSSTIREAADSALRMLNRMADCDEAREIRDGVTVEFKTTGPLLDLSKHGLDKEVADDVVLAHSIELRNAAQDEDIVIVTNDIALKLNAQANGFTVVNVPSKYKRPIEPHPDKKLIAELQRDLEREKSKSPRLKLLFVNGQPSIAFPLRSTKLTDEERLRLVRAEKDKHPLVEVRVEESGLTKKRYMLSGLSLEIAAGGMPKVTADQWREYNVELKVYYESFERYLLERDMFDRESRRIFPIELMVSNEGTVPGRNLEVFLVLNGPFELMLHDERATPGKPTPPAEPTPPSAGQALFNPNLKPRMPLWLPDSPHFDLSRHYLDSLKNVSTPSIEQEGDTYRVFVTMRKVKHNQDERFTFLVKFLSEEQVCPFRIDYSIQADNVAATVSGALNIKFELPAASNNTSNE